MAFSIFILLPHEFTALYGHNRLSNMNESSREEKYRELRIRMNDLKALELKMENISETKVKEMKNKIRKELRHIITEIGRREKYTQIEDKINLYCAAKYIDITDQVLEEYDLWFEENL